MLKKHMLQCRFDFFVYKNMFKGINEKNRN